MPSARKPVILTACAFALFLALAGCSLVPQPEAVRVWTPAPVMMPPRPTEGETALPTITAPATAQPATTPAERTTATAAARSTATATRAVTVPTLTPSPTLEPSPTPDPNLVVITEEGIETAVAAGAGAQGGLNLTGLQVRFTDGRMRLTADRLAYGPVVVENLVLVGRLTAQNGALRLETESISPRTLATALIPTLANQALAQYTSQWYIEEVRMLEGRMELRIR